MAREDVRAFNTAEEIRKAEEAQQRFNNLAQQAVDTAKENLENIKKQNSFEKELLGTYKEQEVLAYISNPPTKLNNFSIFVLPTSVVSCHLLVELFIILKLLI